MFPHLKNFNLQEWIDENRGNWGQRRVIWQDSDFITFVTRRPNRRNRRCCSQSLRRPRQDPSRPSTRAPPAPSGCS